MVVFAGVLLVFMVCCCNVVICDAYQNSSGVNGTLGLGTSRVIQSFSRPFLFLDSVEKQINSLADVPLTMILHLVVLQGNGRLRTK